MSLAIVDYPDVSGALALSEGAIAAAQADAGTVWEQDVVDGTSALISNTQPIVDQYNVDNTGSPFAPAPPAPGASGGAPAPGPSQCGTHGLSTIDPSVVVDPKAGFEYLPVASVADGPCTKSYNVAPAGNAQRPITSWRLLQGDPKLFTLATHRNDPSAGIVIWYYDITVHPTTPGKYWCEAELVLPNPALTLKLYFWLDVIP